MLLAFTGPEPPMSYMITELLILRDVNNMPLLLVALRTEVPV